MQTSFELPPRIAQEVAEDKSWRNRLEFSDLMSGIPNTQSPLDENDPRLSTDLQATARAHRQWKEGSDIDVGESGTLYRFLQFAAWKNGEDRVFIKRGTLATRPMTHDPNIVNLPLAELLKLDRGTSQWGSAAVLLGNTETPTEPIHYKLQLTYDALKHWIEARTAGEPWQIRQDKTLYTQMAAYVQWRRTGTMVFEPIQAEDYCIARAFGLITPAEGELRWPSLRTQESDRIAGMEEALEQDIVTSDDHRPVQAVAMLKGHSVQYAHPEAVRKSWPGFWRALHLAS